MKVKWDDRKARENARIGVREAHYRGGEIILAKANETVPFSEGILAGSGFVDADDDLATINYDTPYAIMLHENPQFSFQHGRRGKWLSLTLGEVGDQVRDVMVAAVRGKFG